MPTSWVRAISMLRAALPFAQDQASGWRVRGYKKTVAVDASTYDEHG